MKKRVVIYAKTEKQKENWERAANDNVMSLSKYLQSLIEEAIDGPKITQTQAVTDIKLKSIELEVENKTLKNEILRLNKLLSIQEEELADLRNRAFLEPSFSGVRSFDKQLVSFLQSRDRGFNQDQIMAALNIVYTDSEAIKSLTAQLEALVEYKLVMITGRGWKWVR